jgi:hypothetical protein
MLSGKRGMEKSFENSAGFLENAGDLDDHP